MRQASVDDVRPPCSARSAIRRVNTHEQLVRCGDLRIVVVCRGHVLEYELVVLVGPEPVADVEAIVDLFEEGQAGFDGGLAALGRSREPAASP